MLFNKNDTNSSAKEDIVRPEFKEKFGDKKVYVRKAYLEQLRFDFRKLEEKLKESNNTNNIQSEELNQEQDLETHEDLLPEEPIYEDLYEDKPIKKIEPKTISQNKYRTNNNIQTSHLRKLTDREKEIISLMGKEKVTITQMASFFATSQSAIRTSLSEIRKKGIQIKEEKYEGYPKTFYILQEEIKKFLRI